MSDEQFDAIMAALQKISEGIQDLARDHAASRTFNGGYPVSGGSDRWDRYPRSTSSELIPWRR